MLIGSESQPAVIEPLPVVIKPQPIVMEPQPPVIEDPKTIDVSSYNKQPFPIETTCYFFIPCFYFPTEPICTLPVNTCGGAYTFANSCYLSLYKTHLTSNRIFDCEHKSNCKFCIYFKCYRSRHNHYFCYSIL